MPYSIMSIYHQKYWTKKLLTLAAWLHTNPLSKGTEQVQIDDSLGMRWPRYVTNNGYIYIYTCVTYYGNINLYIYIYICSNNAYGPPKH